MSDKLREAALAAMDAMKLARGDHGTIMLAYPAIESWLYHRVDQRLDDAIKEVDNALAEPEQEPMHPEIKKMYEDYFDKCFRESSAQQRPWVGLTGDEIEDLNKDQTLWEIIRAAEAKLKEKNYD